MNKLQEDIIKIKGNKIFLNPFLYSRKFDEKTHRWLKEIGQLKYSQIIGNRKRFYQELDWSYLSDDEKIIKDSTIEFFLKTLEIIKIFHPNLNKEEILEVERKLIICKKFAFEKWVKKYIKTKSKLSSQKERKMKRQTFINKWREWFSMKETKKAFLPFFVIINISLLIGWYAGISKNSCNPYFESSFIKKYNHYG